MWLSVQLKLNNSKLTSKLNVNSVLSKKDQNLWKIKNHKYLGTLGAITRTVKKFTKNRLCFFRNLNGHKHISFEIICHFRLITFLWGSCSGFQIANFSLYPHLAGERKQTLSWLIKVLIAFMRAPSSWLHLILIPTTVTENKVSAYEFGEEHRVCNN